jgi:hypothetical protein
VYGTCQRAPTLAKNPHRLFVTAALANLYLGEVTRCENSGRVTSDAGAIAIESAPGDQKIACFASRHHSLEFIAATTEPNRGHRLEMCEIHIKSSIFPPVGTILFHAHIQGGESRVRI